MTQKWYHRKDDVLPSMLVVKKNAFDGKTKAFPFLEHTPLQQVEKVNLRTKSVIHFSARIIVRIFFTTVINQ